MSLFFTLSPSLLVCLFLRETRKLPLPPSVPSSGRLVVQTDR